ncbi:hypothetical protein BC628DRAFT_923494 [Trametes gibbosa]|nr:hypothetical protein BC628DRAFT_923494 [Trametes gibbosa]
MGERTYVCKLAGGHLWGHVARDPPVLLILGPACCPDAAAPVSTSRVSFVRLLGSSGGRPFPSLSPRKNTPHLQLSRKHFQARVSVLTPAWASTVAYSVQCKRSRSLSQKPRLPHIIHHFHPPAATPHRAPPAQAAPTCSHTPARPRRTAPYLIISPECNPNTNAVHHRLAPARPGRRLATTTTITTTTTKYYHPPGPCARATFLSPRTSRQRLFRSAHHPQPTLSPTPTAHPSQSEDAPSGLRLLPERRP